MPVGNLKQKANPILVSFVFGCILVVTGFLYTMQKSVAVANNLSVDVSKY